MAAYVRERLAKLAARQEELTLHDKVLGLGERLEDVAQAVQRGDTTTALAVVTSTYSDVRGYEKEADRRAAELEAGRLWATEMADHIRAELKDPTVKEYFAGECSDILGQLETLTNRLPDVHGRWAREHAREALADHLRELEEEARHAVAAPPTTRDLDLARGSPSNR